MKESIELAAVPLLISSDLSQKETPSPTERTLSTLEKWAVFLLHLLYFIQGIPFGFFALAIPYLLVEKGADFADIGILSICLYPFCFKFILAPIEDIHFFPGFGKRKSYIIPVQYIMAALFFILSFLIDSLMNDFRVGWICAIGTTFITLNAVQDVAVDGWVLTLLNSENLSWGSVSQNVGQVFGIIVGGNVLIQLSSSHSILATSEGVPLISIPNLLRLFALIILFINVWVHLRVGERNPAKNEYHSVWQLARDLKGFYTNKNLRYFVIFCLFWQLGFAAVGSTASLKLIQKGFPKETIALVSMSLTPINFFLSYLMGKYSRVGTEMTIYLRIYIAIFFHNIYLYILVTIYDGQEGSLFLIFFVLAALIGDGTVALAMVNQGGFVNRISDEDVGGTFVTFLNASWNLGRFGGNSLMYFLVDSLNYSVVVVFGWVYALVFFGLFYRKLLSMERLKKEEWKL